MILHTKQAESITEGTEKSIGMTIDESDKAVLMQILSEGLYKDPIGSTIREWTSNALDSHVEAGVDEPVVVGLKQDSSYNTWFTVTDFGMGISPDRLEKIVSKYAASTKRHSNTMLGAYGLGLKSGLSYADSFTFTTRYDGTEYQYIMYKAEEGTKIDQIYSKTTTERNGTTFTLKLKNYRDRAEFVNKCRQQLCYFEKVFFDITEIRNDFSIIKSEDWKFSELSSDNSLHLSLDNVYYPLDFSKLGISIISMPIALNFNIGEGVEPIPSREDIKYTPSAKDAILKKLRKAVTAIFTKYNEKYVEVERFSEIIEHMNYRYFYINNTKAVELSALQSYSDVALATPKIRGIDKVNLNHLYTLRVDLFEEYVIRGYIYRGKFYGKEEKEAWSLCKGDKHGNNGKLILAEDRPKGVQLDYIKETVGDCYFVYQRWERQLEYSSGSNKTGYLKLLGVEKKTKSEQKEAINQCKELIKREIEAITTPIKNYVPTEEWLQKRKEGRAIGSRTIVGKEEVFPRYCIKAHGGGVTWTFKTEGKVRIEQLLVQTHRLMVYGLQEEREALENIHSAFRQTGQVQTAIVSPRDFGRLQQAQLHNWKSIKEFMKGDNTPFRILATTIVSTEFTIKYGGVYKNLSMLKHLDLKLHEKVTEIMAFQKKHSYGYYNAYYELKAQFKESILTIARANKLWYYPVYQYIQDAEKALSDKLDFLNGTFTSSPSLARALQDSCKYRKYRLNLELYNRPVGAAEEQLPEKGEDEELGEDYEEDYEEYEEAI